MPSIADARAWYPAEDPVHGFDHVLRVHHLAERLARLEGADVEIVCAAALLHDAQGVTGPEEVFTGQLLQRQDHHLHSTDFASQVLAGEGWPEGRIHAVLHCIRAHRFRDASVQPETLEARVLFDADKLDAIGAIGVARAIAYAVSHGQPVYAELSARFMESGQKEPGEPHSAYHEFVFKLIKLKDRLYTPSAKALADERHNFMAQFYQRLRHELEGLV